jgi:hypothetical protein
MGFAQTTLARSTYPRWWTPAEAAPERTVIPITIAAVTDFMILLPVSLLASHREKAPKSLSLDSLTG